MNEKTKNELEKTLEKINYLIGNVDIFDKEETLDRIIISILKNVYSEREYWQKSVEDSKIVGYLEKLKLKYYEKYISPRIKGNS